MSVETASFETASFGAWVRRRRLTLDLTQAELAQRVACAPITIRKIEGDERRPSKVMAERLADALDLETDSRDRFVATARAVTSPTRLMAPAAAAAFGAGGDLPAPPNRCIGRTSEIADILERLHVSGGPSRLLTITGPPGVGKTRLVIEIATRAERKFDVPVVFVDLSNAADAGQVPARIASAVSVPAAALVDGLELAVHALRRSPALLVLDNFEHVIDAADHVQTLVESCPELVCLVTSRAPLELYGEHVHPLDPLPLTPDASSEDGLGERSGAGLGSPALELFVERATAADPHLDPAADADAVAAICELLDGLPLAIELAALRTRQLPPQALLADLRASTGADVLGATGRGRTARQRSAEGAVAWSYELLSPPARRVLIATSVFPGGFNVDAAQAVSDLDAAELRAALDELTTHALLQSAPVSGESFDQHTVHYLALMVVREFARRRLRDEGRFDELSRRHSELTAARVEAVSSGIAAWPERRAIDQLAGLDGDVQAALHWSFGPAGEVHLGRRLVAASLPLWHFRGQIAVCLRWATAHYDSLGTTEDRYEGAYYLAVSLWSAGELERAGPLIEEAVRGAEQAGDALWLAEALGMQQLFALTGGDIAAAEALAPRCLASAELAGGEWLLLAHLRSARLALLRGDTDAAAGHVAASTELTARHGGTWGRSNAAGVRGDLALALGDPSTAIDEYVLAVDGFLAVDAVVYAIARVATIANALVAAGDHERAAVVCGVVEGWCDEIGAPLHPIAAFTYAVHRGEAEERLGARYAAVEASGRDLPRSADAVREVLGVLIAP